MFEEGKQANKTTLSRRATRAISDRVAGVTSSLGMTAKEEL
jgi:hypothetical protein